MIIATLAEAHSDEEREVESPRGLATRDPERGKGDAHETQHIDNTKQDDGVEAAKPGVGEPGSKQGRGVRHGAKEVGDGGSLDAVVKELGAVEREIICEGGVGHRLSELIEKDE